MRIAQIIFECAPYAAGFLSWSGGVFILWGRRSHGEDVFDYLVASEP